MRLSLFAAFALNGSDCQVMEDVAGLYGASKADMDVYVRLDIEDLMGEQADISTVFLGMLKVKLVQY